MIEPDELAAVIAAVAATMQQTQEPSQPVSPWKRTARLEGVDAQ